MALRVHEKRTQDVVDSLLSDIVKQPTTYVVSTGCIIYKGKSKKKDGNGGFYGRITRTYNGHKHDLLVHQVAWMAGQTPTAIVCPAPVSHLCHENMCINSNHLVCEPQEVNNKRIACHNKGYCTETNRGHYFLDENMERCYEFQGQPFKNCIF